MLKMYVSDYDAIRRHGEATYPHECCGILIGTIEGGIRTVHSVIHCENVCTESPQTRYEIDPRKLIRAQREAHERGLDIIGFYHSHPDHPPRWSATDLEHAHWIGCSYVIISVESGRATQTNSFALTGTTEDDKVLVEEEIVCC
jgi:proteasome lid subunit RPN8/RPN11